MEKSLRICFRIAKEVGLAVDENGNNGEAYVCAKSKGVKSYTLEHKQYDTLVQYNRKMVAKSLNCDEKYVIPITLNEYLDNTEEEDE